MAAGDPTGGRQDRAAGGKAQGPLGRAQTAGGQSGAQPEGDAAAG